MTHRFRILILMLILLLLPCAALAEVEFPLIAAEVTVDCDERESLLKKSAENDYDWFSSDKRIAAVDYRGRVTGRSTGSCIIFAQAEDGTVYSCTVTVVQPVTRVKIDASSHTMDVGKTYRIEPEIRPSDATDKTIVYTSSDETVAQVDENGIVTALKKGKATVTASSVNGLKDTIRITVTQPVTSIVLNKNEVTVENGKSFKLKAEIAPSNADNKTLTWTTSDKNIARVSSKGEISARKAGSCIITATAKSGVQVSCIVTVTQPVTSVRISDSSYTMDIGKTHSVAAKVSPSDATDKTIVYTSSDETVAQVDENGIVTALKKGKATITASSHNGLKDTIRITVTQPVTALSLSKSEVTVEADRYHKLTAAIEPANADNKTLTWTTSDKNIARVSSKGEISARKAGSCIITATAKSGVQVSCIVTVTQPVTSVKIADSSRTVDIGSTYRIEPKVSPSDATDKTIVYTSSDETVAQVDENGIVTALKKGKATITASSVNGKKDTVRITVTKPVESVQLSKSEVSISAGYSHKLTAVAEPSDADNKTLTWTTSDKNIARVSSRGEISARKAGSCIITATAKSGVQASCIVTVTQPVTSVKIADSSRTLDIGRTYSAAAKVSPSDATDKTVLYTSSDETVAQVDENGIVTALKKGKATITASSVNGKKDTVRITVTQPVTFVQLSKSEVSIGAGYSHKLTAVIEPSDATDKTLTWTTSDRNIARVSGKGEISARKVGSCIITATAKSGVQVSCIVTVTQPVSSVRIADSSKTVYRNQTYQLVPEVRPSDATDKRITFHSSNPAVASVSESGLITAHADGKATITASAHNGKNDTVRITVKSIAVKSVELNQGYLRLYTGETAKLNAAVSPSDASEPGVRLYSSNPEAAVIGADGTVTAIGAGETVIRAVSADNGSIYDECRVYVRDAGAPGRLEGIVIGINPGHQVKGDYSKAPLAPGSSETGTKVGMGCVGVKTKECEYQVNLEVSLILRDLLEAEGASVVMTRTSNNVNISNIQRAEMLNAANVDLALQIHCNSSSTGDPRRNGIEVYAKTTDKPGQQASEYILENMVEHTRAVNLGAKQLDEYMSLNWSRTPALLIEMGYMSNAREDVLLSTPSYQMKLAAGIYEGIAEYFGR